MISIILLLDASIQDVPINMTGALKPWALAALTNPRQSLNVMLFSKAAYNQEEDPVISLKCSAIGISKSRSN
jgi:hypothetical protein